MLWVYDHRNIIILSVQGPSLYVRIFICQSKYSIFQALNISRPLIIFLETPLKEQLENMFLTLKVLIVSIAITVSALKELKMAEDT